ncbi:MAG: AI-2E family transporter [Luteolibacter sp.]
METTDSPPPEPDGSTAQAGEPSPKDAPNPTLELHIPWMTFARIFAAILAAYAVYVLWPLLLLVYLALFLAVTLHAGVEWLDGKGVRHWLSLSILIGGLISLLGVGLALIVPSLMEQASALSRSLPRLHEQVLRQLPVGETLRQNLDHMLDTSNWSYADKWFGHFVSAGGIALGGLSEIVLVLVIALYLLIDGSKTFEWLLAFFSPLKRAKLRITAEEISQVIFGYVVGQIITSSLVAVYAFAVLSLLKVPGALMLAVLAGVLDILPVIGFVISTLPAFLLAFSVSTKTALIVLGLYLLFHLLENYIIIPKVYGKSLRVSTLTVLLGLLAGTLLAGIPGALAALPVIASYAAIERIWLKPFLRDGVSEKHELQKDREFGEKT